MRPTTIGSEVLVVIDGKTKKGKIVEDIQGAARIELGKDSHALASHSLKGENGTFHYPDEAEAMKAAKADSEKLTPAAAAPAKPVEK